MFNELEHNDSIFGLSARKFSTGSQTYDYSVRFHGKPASSPLGPAAGPQTQMAQNIVLAWLAGCRIMELKTVQIMDELQIPRPCIDMETVGYNVEWSQELKLAQSLDEYVKASMLIQMLAASGKVALAPDFDKVIFDISVGYDLAGIKSEPIQSFIEGMKDASAHVERFRAQIPAEYADLAKLPFETKLSDTLTLSTFHGCPPLEIEKIIEFLFRENGLSCIIKLNPTLLGKLRARELLNNILGYEGIEIPDSAFDNDASWEQAVGFVDRLGEVAKSLGLGFGVKFTNTLLVKNNRSVFPEKEAHMYMSGTPLHVLAMNLVAQFRAHFGDRFPITFAAGIDSKNFPDAVALGLAPITVCSDLLTTGGYGRTATYYKALDAQMKDVSAQNIGDYIIRAYDQGLAALNAVEMDPDDAAACRGAYEEGGGLLDVASANYAAWVSAAKLLNTKHYVELVTENSRYALVENAKGPKKVGSQLALFDCLTCDKCIPVCPNNANFSFDFEQVAIPGTQMVKDGATWLAKEGTPIEITKKHQLGNFHDFCNECGNCDTFCPEDGGPYLAKPRFFSSVEEWKRHTTHDGFAFTGELDFGGIQGRFKGAEFSVWIEGGKIRFKGPDFDASFEEADPSGTFTASKGAQVDLQTFYVMRRLQKAVLATTQVNLVKTVAD